MSERYRLIDVGKLGRSGKVYDSRHDRGLITLEKTVVLLNGLDAEVSDLKNRLEAATMHQEWQTYNVLDRERLDFLDRADGRTLEAIDYEHSINARASFRAAVDAVRAKVEGTP